MTLREEIEAYIESLDTDVEAIKAFPGKGCCDATEEQTLTNVSSALFQILSRVEEPGQTSFAEALDIVESEDDWMEHVNEFTAQNIAGTITHIDLEEFTRLIVCGPDVEYASKLYRELKYWKHMGRIS